MLRIFQYQTTTKHSKTWTMCIIVLLGCIWDAKTLDSSSISWFRLQCLSYLLSILTWKTNRMKARVIYTNLSLLYPFSLQCRWICSMNESKTKLVLENLQNVLTVYKMPCLAICKYTWKIHSLSKRSRELDYHSHVTVHCLVLRIN